MSSGDREPRRDWSTIHEWFDSLKPDDCDDDEGVGCESDEEKGSNCDDCDESTEWYDGQIYNEDDDDGQPLPIAPLAPLPIETTDDADEPH